MKSVLLHINQDPGQAARLAAAMEVVRAHNGQLICLQATPLDAYFFVGDPFGGSYVPSGIFETFRQNEKLEQVRIEDTLKREGIDWQWLHAEGSAAQTIIEHAKFADLVVLSQPEEKETILPRRAPLAADVALHVQSPVLLVPAAGQRFTNSSAAMIAWNGSPEAANAIRQSRSLLRAAPKLHIVSVSEKGEKPSLDDVRNYLARSPPKVMIGRSTETPWPMRSLRPQRVSKQNISCSVPMAIHDSAKLFWAASPRILSRRAPFR